MAPPSQLQPAAVGRQHRAAHPLPVPHAAQPRPAAALQRVVHERHLPAPLLPPAAAAGQRGCSGGRSDCAALTQGGDVGMAVDVHVRADLQVAQPSTGDGCLVLGGLHGRARAGGFKWWLQAAQAGQQAPQLAAPRLTCISRCCSCSQPTALPISATQRGQRSCLCGRKWLQVTTTGCCAFDGELQPWLGAGPPSAALVLVPLVGSAGAGVSQPVIAAPPLLASSAAKLLLALLARCSSPWLQRSITCHTSPSDTGQLQNLSNLRRCMCGGRRGGQHLMQLVCSGAATQPLITRLLARGSRLQHARRQVAGK